MWVLSFWLLIFTRDNKDVGVKMSKEDFREFSKFKTCKTCQKERLRSSFYHHDNYKDKLFSSCKFCMADKAKGKEIIPEPLTVSERVKLYFEQKQ